MSSKCEIKNCCGLPLVPHDGLGRIGIRCMVCDKENKEGQPWSHASLKGVCEVMKYGIFYLYRIFHCDSQECETTANRTLAHMLSKMALPFQYVKNWDEKRAQDVVQLVCTPETLTYTGGWKRFSKSRNKVSAGFELNGFWQKEGQVLIRMVKVNNHNNYVDVPLEQVIQYNLDAMKGLGPLGEIEFPALFPESHKARFRACLEKWNEIVNGK